MISMKDDILPYLEWEVLREPITIPKVEDARELPEGPKKIVINRDECYKLQALLSMKGDSKLFTEKIKDVVPGSFVKPFEITGSDQDGFIHYTLESCCLVGSQTCCERGEEPLSEANIFIEEVRRRYKTETESARLTEWYINGPKDKFVFRNTTTRKISTTFTRERLASKDEIIHSLDVSNVSRMSSHDFLRIKASDNEFLVTKVPEEFEPIWSSNIGIEYRKEWGRIPDVEEREKISELCNFIFGRHLLLVGYTIYDKDNNIVEEYACNPWGNNIRYLCSEPDFAPVRINSPSTGGKADDLISQLLPPYLDARDSFHLNHALWFYWIAHNTPVGTNLPLLASAVEAMMNGWFKFDRSESHGKYMREFDFEDLLRDDINSIQKKLEGKTYGDEVMNKIKRAYNLGTGDRFRFFFNEIKLVVNDNEWEAIEARHPPAHGRISISPEEWRRVIQYTHTYETLIHKIMLKLLGYSGSYIDRSGIGWEDKQLI